VELQLQPGHVVEGQTDANPTSECFPQTQPSMICDSHAHVQVETGFAAWQGLPGQNDKK